MTSQRRRAAASVASDIVEGCARESRADYVRFVEIAYGSARELEYQATLARRLNFMSEENATELEDISVETSKVLNGLLRALRK